MATDSAASALPMQHPTERLPDLQAQIERELLVNLSAASTDLSWLAMLLGKSFGADSCAIANDFGCPLAWWGPPGSGFGKGFAAQKHGGNDNRDINDGDACARVRAAAEMLQSAGPWQVDDLDAMPLLADWWRPQLPNVKSVLGLGVPVEPASQETAGWILLARTEAWEPGWADALAALATKLSLVLSCWRQRYWSERARQARQAVTQVCHGASDSIHMQQLSLRVLAEATAAARALVLNVKYAEPLLRASDRQTIPRAKLEIASHWAPSRSGEGSDTTAPQQVLQLADSPICSRAWQVAPGPSTLLVPAESADPLFDPNTAVVLAPLTGRSGSNESLPPMILGFLALQREACQPWQDWEGELIAWAAMQLGTAMVYSRTLRRVQGLVDERTAQLQRSLDVQAKLYETSRQQVEQLRQLNLLKDEFLSTISHELNTPLATMRMAIQMLRQPELPAERRDLYLGILEKELKRESNLIGDLLTLQQMETESNPLQPQRLDLKAIVRELAEAFADAWGGRSLQLRVSYLGAFTDASEVVLYSESVSIQRILQELLANAGKYSDPETEVGLEVVSLPEPPGHIAISVTNIGPGIAPSEREAIFEQFRRGRGATQQAIPGTGLGLALVKCLTRHLQGTIEVESDYREGASGETRFTLTLPETPTVG